MSGRQRKDGYVVSDKAKAVADLLYSIVVKIDCGEPHYRFADDVENIAKVMRK